LPFAIEVDRASATERPIDNLQVARILRRRAQELNALLEELAKEFGINVSLQVYRGYFLQAALEACTGLDFLFLNRIGHRREIRAVGRTWSEHARRQQTAARPVVVLLDDQNSAARTLTAAKHLLWSEQPELLVLLPQDKTLIMTEPVQNVMKDYDHPSRIQILAHRDLDTLLQTLSDTRCGLLVLDRTNAEQLGLLSQDSLNTLDYPIVLVPSNES
jgi:hypothetical protein